MGSEIVFFFHATKKKMDLQICSWQMCRKSEKTEE